MSAPDYYRILLVQPDAPAPIIHASYRTLVRCGSPLFGRTDPRRNAELVVERDVVRVGRAIRAEPNRAYRLHRAARAGARCSRRADTSRAYRFSAGVEFMTLSFRQGLGSFGPPKRRRCSPPRRVAHHDCAPHKAAAQRLRTTGGFHVCTALRRALAIFSFFALAFGAAAQSTVSSPRLYVFDGGVLASETARYRLTDADVEEVELSVASFLIVHPRGVLMWDAGAVADASAAAPLGSEQRLVRRDDQERFVKLAPALDVAARGRRATSRRTSRISHCRTTIGTTRPTRILFAHAQWLVPKLEHDAMFRADPPGGTRPETYSA